MKTPREYLAAFTTAQTTLDRLLLAAESKYPKGHHLRLAYEVAAEFNMRRILFFENLLS